METLRSLHIFCFLVAVVGMWFPRLTFTLKVVTHCTVPYTIALTFEDGPLKFTKNMVRTLDEYGAKATFFVDGAYRGNLPGPAGKIPLCAAYKSGHQIASYISSHKNLTEASSDIEVVNGIMRIDNEVFNIIGARMAHFRPPYDLQHKATNDTLGALGYTSIVLWSFESQDSPGSSVDSSTDELIKALHSSSSHIVRMTDTSTVTVYELVPAFIRELKSRAIKLTTVAECIGEAPYREEVGGEQTC